MEWLYYLLEANLYLLLFYGFYKLLLAKTTFYNSNRYFLLVSLLLAFLIPFVQLSYLKPVISSYQHSGNGAIEDYNPVISIEFIVQICYVMICSILIVRLISSLLKITYLWKNGKKHSTNNYTIIELNEKPAAFSFFNLLFIHPRLMDNDTVMRHEMVHIKEKHSYDLLLLECVQITSWFNPIIYFIRKDLKLLHEFIADQATTKEQINKHEYAMFLIESSLNNFSIPFTNQFFNPQTLKQRINMLNKEKTAKWVKLHFALAIPLLLGMLFLSTLAFSKDYGYFDLLPNIKTVQDTTKKIKKPLPPPPKQDQYPAPPPRGKKDQVKFPPPVVKPNEKNLKNPPPVEPPPPGYRTKKDQVKFPPPVVKPNEKNLKNPPPVEPPPPGNRAKKDQVKFPPPVVKPIEKTTSSKMIEGDPIKQPEVKEVVIYGNPISTKNN
jgi:hypothetical protein